MPDEFHFHTHERAATDRGLAVALHHGDLNVLGTGLYDLEQTLDRQPDRIIPRLVLLVILFQKLSDSLGRSPDSRGLDRIARKDVWLVITRAPGHDDPRKSTGARPACSRLTFHAE